MRHPDLPMSSISRATDAPRRRSASRVRASLAWALVLLLAISPIPLGSTTPLSWSIWCFLLGLCAAIYALAQGVRGGRPPASASMPLRIGMVLYGLLCAYLLIQALPLGDLIAPFAVTVSDGSSIAFRTLSVSPGDTWLMLVQVISFGILFFLVREVARDHKLRNFLLRSIVLIAVAHALYALVALYQLDDTLLGSPKTKYFGSATGTFLNRNSFANFLALGLVVALTLAMRSLVQRRHDRLRISLDTAAMLYLVAVAILMTTIVLTNSRAGLGVAVIGILIVLSASLSTNFRGARSLVVIVPIALILFVGMFLATGEQLWLRFEDTASDFNFRLELYKQVIDLIAQRPFLGFGGGAFEQAFPIAHTSRLPNDLTWDKAHNTYLELWADLGLIAGSIPMILVAGLAIMLVIGLVQRRGSMAGQTVAIAAIAIGGFHSIVDFSLQIETIAFMFITLCAIGLASTETRTAEA